MSQTAYNPQDIRAKAEVTRYVAEEIQDLLKKLTSHMNELQQTWQGPAATAMDGKFSEFHARAHNMAVELEGISRIMTRVADDHQATEDHIAQVIIQS
jgi:WXG100 family type VII secretion target